MAKYRWALAFSLIGIILAGLGFLPLWLTLTFFPGADSVLFALMFYSLTPLGVVVLAVALVIWIVSFLRR